MITDVTTDGFEPADLPAKFEAGTPAFVEAVGTSAAVDYLQNIGFDKIRNYEYELTKYALEMFEEQFGKLIKVHGPKLPENRLQSN